MTIADGTYFTVHSYHISISFVIFKYFGCIYLGEMGILDKLFGEPKYKLVPIKDTELPTREVNFSPAAMEILTMTLNRLTELIGQEAIKYALERGEPLEITPDDVIKVLSEGPFDLSATIQKD